MQRLASLNFGLETLQRVRLFFITQFCVTPVVNQFVVVFAEFWRKAQ